MAFIETIQANPVISILLFSLAISLFITIVNYFVLDKEKMKNLKLKQKELQAKMKEHKDNPQKLAELNKEMMAGMGESMRHSFKPMLITIIPVLLLFGWINPIFKASSLGGSWIWYYIVSSIIFSMILRKVFKLP